MKIISTVAASLLLSGSLWGNPQMQEQIDSLTKEIESIKKKQDLSSRSILDIKKKTNGDNLKFSLEFRNGVDILHYEDKKNNKKSKNDGLFTSRLFLDMVSSPMKGLMFKGRLAIYSSWGAKLYVDDDPLKDWAGSSRPSDTVMRIREGYFVYSTGIGSQPIKFSIGRRPATNGFLANMRENEQNPGSPLSHITNMEVNGAMVMLDLNRYMSGAYVKLVYGRAHTGDMTNVYGTNNPATLPWGPYATTGEDEDSSVDFFVMPGVAYNDGQHQVMYQWAHIFNTKGLNTATSVKKVAAGSADLFALSYKINGLDEDSDFLFDTSLFASLAYSHYDANDGYILNGSKDGGTSRGHSFWAGANIPDMITESGKLGFEYNYGSKYWTPMTWAEDTAIGSKVAVRGSAYEAYWNFDLFGVQYLPSQIRYTYVQHDYTPNINCSGWTPVEEADIVAQDLRFFITYKY